MEQRIFALARAWPNAVDHPHVLILQSRVGLEVVADDAQDRREAESSLAEHDANRHLDVAGVCAGASVALPADAHEAPYVVGASCERLHIRRSASDHFLPSDLIPQPLH